MNKDFEIHKAAGLIIVDKKLLLEKSGGQDIYVVPGGRIEEGEISQETLVRELFEEFKITANQSDFEFFGSYIVKNAKIEGSKVKMETFLVKKWVGDIQIDNEIESIAWVDSSNSQNLKISPFAVDIVIPLLNKKDLIN
ncbi:hypothetical protein A3F07_01620 [candidate division WWE3 bacterium RIFCSPHIGHO2_12_FULL_38_15]|uniref:8-oxo-dGTP diphosphatase n=1 Tax=candidate division WWE3 bacterium RIFCSPHIGHO2_02_FULL_38_14 TaxID=1802620 RepID=A0A1F4V8P4_UNCKA|nr:MAG: hypothetical protein A2793_01680 [candidate division WWE3 bacterium RIFCSPHIGHO2_01_FULL_38_45]OGC48404.1 MAG: hypothetical protein A3F07_01620 [candidate division WWE3 bacterium RIFCSPHIGHO2_12_FULL_38_15]OGC53621.1 MAG: hypothetical protein A3D91_04235 [candidate division WWE3 bacterium RIFCSPHIGHO2_02_FULL_38_14]OGC54337.1 MAG: hypothetical protein A3B64_02415 [candidate division WWE3 bacterium RIFCSPLOWO2_01_FULL_37_24]HLB51582.1 NUDIX domain-containing protein [Patescibacteria grou